MSRKSRFSFEVKLKAVKQYLNGERNYPSIANALDVPDSTIRMWVKAYQVDGEDALKSHKRNKRYSKEFKLECAAAYLAGEGSYLDLANKFGLRSTCQLRQWVIKYNSHRELKDHDPIPEAYMTSRRKTTLEERQSIVKYCKKHNWNYKETAIKYGCSYAQVYNWCKKYQAQGSKGLKDKRGHRLKESDLTETERLKREVEHLRVQNQIKDREIAFLKKSEGFREDVVIGQPKQRQIALKHSQKQTLYELIKQCHQEYKWPIDWMCKQVNIARSAYYKWLKHTPSKRELRDQMILERIKSIAKSNNSLFGSPKMTLALNKELEEDEPKIYRRTVARLMCVNYIYTSKARFNKKYRYKASRPEETSANVLNRNFNASKPNEKWCTDITEEKIPGTGQKIYLCTIFDLYDRYPVGYALSQRNDTALVNAALRAAWKKEPDSHAMLHSDRGFQFTRAPFTNELTEHGMSQSMSRVGRCIDNGPMEGWQGIIKEMRIVLYPEINSYEEMKQAFDKTIDYYINYDPQERFEGKTAGEVRAEAKRNPSKVKEYKIKQDKRYKDYWEEIEAKKNQPA